jgi:hypothetical protein
MSVRSIRSACLSAQRANDGFEVPHAGEFEAEVFADFNGFALGNGFVVDAEFEGFVWLVGGACGAR